MGPVWVLKIKKSNIAVVADIRDVLTKLNAVKKPNLQDMTPWHDKIQEWKDKLPMDYRHDSPYILPPQAIEELWKATRDKDTIIATGVGQHQMWTAQF